MTDPNKLNLFNLTEQINERFGLEIVFHGMQEAFDTASLKIFENALKRIFQDAVKSITAQYFQEKFLALAQAGLSYLPGKVGFGMATIIKKDGENSAITLSLTVDADDLEGLMVFCRSKDLKVEKVNGRKLKLTYKFVVEE